MPLSGSTLPDISISSLLPCELDLLYNGLQCEYLVQWSARFRHDSSVPCKGTHIRTAATKDQAEHRSHREPLWDGLDKYAPCQRHHFRKDRSTVVQSIQFSLFQGRARIYDFRGHDIFVGGGGRSLKVSEGGASSRRVHGTRGITLGIAAVIAGRVSSSFTCH